MPHYTRPAKRHKTLVEKDHAERKAKEAQTEEQTQAMESRGVSNFIVQFSSQQNEETGTQMELPIGTTPKQLTQLINQVFDRNRN